MLYHVSGTSGLKTLQPRVSTHKKAYVYAIENMVTGLLFGARCDDFDFIISTDDDGAPAVFECYPDAFKKVYQGKSCSVYEVSDEGFLRGMTSWEPELVCENEVEVLREVFVNDIYQRLLEEESKGNLEIIRYEHSDEYRKMIYEHIFDRIARFGIDLDTIADKDERFLTYHKDIISVIRDKCRKASSSPGSKY